MSTMIGKWGVQSVILTKKLPTQFVFAMNLLPSGVGEEHLDAVHADLAIRLSEHGATEREGMIRGLTVLPVARDAALSRR